MSRGAIWRCDCPQSNRYALLQRNARVRKYAGQDAVLPFDDHFGRVDGLRIEGLTRENAAGRLTGAFWQVEITKAAGFAIAATER